MPLISWERFAVTNIDARGLRLKFEDLCRQLFTNEFLSANSGTRNVHCNPNNPGIEADPVLDEQNNRWIGFQVKYFDSDVRYEQILKSASETVQYYEGQIDRVYLYCNKPLSSSAENFIKAKNLLSDHNITLELITDVAVLDIVRKYPYLANYYFGTHGIDKNWIETHNRYMLEALGDRYNSVFNVGTLFTDQLSLFVRDKFALKIINGKKKKLLSAVDELYWKQSSYQTYFNRIREFVNTLDDVDYDNLEAAYLWYSNLRDYVKEFKEQFDEKLRVLQIRKRELEDSEEARSRTGSSTVTDMSRSELPDINNEIDALEGLISLPDCLLCTDSECHLIKQRVMMITGDAGIGKSQLIANKVKELSECGRDSVLFLAGLYYTDESIQNQIAEKCDLNLSFAEIIDDLEARAEAQDKIIPIFIDALNETWNLTLWKDYLPRLADVIQNHDHLKLIVSFRNEYRKLLLNDSLESKLKDGEICHIFHEGFRYNTVEATRQFLNAYGIPFTPYEFLEYKMENPLFLTLYCRTYDGSEVDLPSLYDRLISNANKNIWKKLVKTLTAKGYIGNEDMLTSLIEELAGVLIDNDSKSLSKEDILQLSFWRQWGLTAIPFIHLVEDEHILIDYNFDDQQRFYFSYDQMNDYFCAKAVMKHTSTKEEVRGWVTKNILQTATGDFVSYGRRDLFINICLLYEERYGETCIDLIEKISDEYERDELYDKYLESFLWRNRRQIKQKEFKKFIESIPISIDTLWKVLIGNSVKLDHPLNAEFLHSLLLSFEMNRRDYVWTTFINRIYSNDSDRITQIVTMYDRGETIAFEDSKQTELLLVLFGWFLTSSDRLFRDRISKAMVEILKKNFDLCEWILKKFADVNDPYVIQRLYGVVYGACCKSENHTYEQYKSLIEYVYCSVFNKDEIYPDILLRDYARLIIEKYLYDCPDYGGCIDKNKITPPYKSVPIPQISRDYAAEKFEGGLYSICSSMRFEKMGMYGDFGRYVFQSALRSFDVDLTNIFNYAMSFIINDLGYKSEWFDDFDHFRSLRSYNRHSTMKIERIGKKYQWIAMYNILARVSDNCKMHEPYSWKEEHVLTFEGAWDPYVRDFDPTLNKNFMYYPEAPYFETKEQFVLKAQEEIAIACCRDDFSVEEWIQSEDLFLKNMKDLLILKDSADNDWILLTTYIQTREGNPQNQPAEWCWLYAYFVNPEQEKNLADCVANHIDLPLYALYSHNETYALFNREYPWSPACASFIENEWIDVLVKPEVECARQNDEGFEKFKSLLKEYGGDTFNEESDAYVLADFTGGEDFDEKEHHQPVEADDEKQTENLKFQCAISHNMSVEIGKILRASSDLLWEEEYDASKEEAICWSVPCSAFIETEELCQKEFDGYYFDKNGELGAFDTSLTQNGSGVVVRKDLLDDFLRKRNLKLLWFAQAEKEYHTSTAEISNWSNWDGMLRYDGDAISGQLQFEGMRR